MCQAWRWGSQRRSWLSFSRPRWEGGMLRPGSRVKLPVQCVADGRCSLLYKEFRSHYLTELIVPVPRRGNRRTEGGPLAKVTQQVTDDLSPRPVSTVPHAKLFPGVNGRGRSPWGVLLRTQHGSGWLPVSLRCWTCHLGEILHAQMTPLQRSCNLFLFFQPPSQAFSSRS